MYTKMAWNPAEVDYFTLIGNIIIRCMDDQYSYYEEKTGKWIWKYCKICIFISVKNSPCGTNTKTTRFFCALIGFLVGCLLSPYWDFVLSNDHGRVNGAPVSQQAWHDKDPLMLKGIGQKFAVLLYKLWRHNMSKIYLDGTQKSDQSINQLSLKQKRDRMQIKDST